MKTNEFSEAVKALRELLRTAMALDHAWSDLVLETADLRLIERKEMNDATDDLHTAMVLVAGVLEEHARAEPAAQAANDGPSSGLRPSAHQEQAGEGAADEVIRELQMEGAQARRERDEARELHRVVASQQRHDYARADAAQATAERLRESWIAARHVVFAARAVCSAWPADLDFGKPGTSIGNLRDVVTAYDQRNHDAGVSGGPSPSGLRPSVAPEGLPTYDPILLEATTAFLAHFMAENAGTLQDRARAGLAAAFPILRRSPEART